MFVAADLTLLYFGVMIVVGFLFLSKIRIKKPTNKQIALMIAIGAAECIGLAVILMFLKNGGARV